MAKKTELTVDDFIADTENLVGKPVTDPGIDPENYQRGWSVADQDYIIAFARSMGDDNPLYTNPVYARKTRYRTLIAYPPWLTRVRLPICRGVLAYGDYPLSQLVAGFGLEFNDAVRVNDSLQSSLYLKELVQKKGRTGRLFFTPVETKFWNQHYELVATGRGNNACIYKEVTSEEMSRGYRDAMLYELDVYHYSEEEVQRIERDIANEVRRGSEPLYWEDVTVGDQLTPVVKGPLTLNDMMHFFALEIWREPAAFGCLEIAYRNSKGGARSGRLNPATGWSYEDYWMEHYDFNLCRARGLPAPFDEGQIRSYFVTHLLANWMGDDGFIRRYYTTLRRPNYYGDTQWVQGEVVRTYRDKVGDQEYGAVDIKIDEINQRGENTAPGTATVYLPSRELGPVTLPIPHEDNYEAYEKYLEDCASRRAEMIEQGFL